MSDVSAPPPTVRRPEAGHFRRNQLVYFTLGALVVGLLLGGAIVGLSRSTTPATGAGLAPPASSGAAATPGGGDVQITTTVPTECLEAADRADAALTTAQRGLQAVQDFDASALRDVLRTLQGAQPVIRDLADQCRSKASASASRVPSTSPGPAASS